jgi:hypothetical protein
MASRLRHQRVLGLPDGTLLIDAPDVGDDEIWVNSRRVTPSSLDAMRKTLGSSLS